LVEAVLVTLSNQHLHDFEHVWKAQLRASTDDDRFWDWELKHRIYLSDSNYEGYAIECDHLTQGMMLIETQQHRSWFAPHRRLVYVHSLATAPWNRPRLPNPRYRAVGGTLLDFARYRSEALGYGGLVGTHALPDAEDFYRRMNMSDCGADEERENLVYFEWYRSAESEFEFDDWDE
jgi:hypothetical protein